MNRVFYISAIGIVSLIFLIFILISFVSPEKPERDQDSDIFQEIMIMKEKNEDLREEVNNLESRLAQLVNQNTALEGVEAEMGRYRKMSGLEAVYGAGISLKIEGKMTVPGMVDLVNEIFASGAQAVSVNEIRLTNRSSGFDRLPQGQIILNGSILTSPYVINAIGDDDNLISALEIPGGILSRIKATSPEVKIELFRKEVVQMK